MGDRIGISRRDFLKGAAAIGIAGAAAVEIGAAAGCSAISGGEVTRSSTVRGFEGDVTVTLTVDKSTGTVKSATIDGPAETPSRGGRACSIMEQEMNEQGTIDVDTVSGATSTSRAIANAAETAYDDCMGKTASKDVRMQPGQYTGAAKGYWQIWDLPVTITVNEDSILKIETPTDRFAHGETEVILQSVKDLYFPRIIETQSIAVDAIAGATSTCNAVRNAVEDALKQALEAGGSDKSAVSAFMATPNLRTEEGESEEIDVDVLVVGMGSGGILAMKAACEQIQKLNGGQRISLLGIDHAGKYGGKSALTHEGSAVNPPSMVQWFNGGADFVDADAFKKIWMDFVTDKATGKVMAKEDVIDMWFEESGKTIDWMYETCYRWGTMVPNDFTKGNTSFNVALTSNTDVGTYEDRRKILDSYYKDMLSAVAAQGGSYMLETEGYELITSGDTVKGVKARNMVTGKGYTINAKAVIMSTGGFLNNSDMCNSLLAEQWRGDRREIGTSQDTGLMIKAALAVGAGTFNIDMSPIVMHVTLDHWLTQYPFNDYEDLLDGRTGRNKVWSLNNIPMAVGTSATTVCVNKSGQRFMDESSYESFARDSSQESWPCFAAGDYYWAIVADEQMQVFADEGFNQIPKFEGYCSQGDIPKDTPVPEVYEGMGYAVDEGLAFKADSIEELAEMIKVDSATLSKTVAQYNDLVASGSDKDMKKKKDYLTKISTGPFYAVKVFTAAFATCGGLDVDTQIRVLKQDHTTPINGLYACGVDSLGVLMHPKRNYDGFGGTAQGWVWTSDRLAGINAANYIQSAYGGFTYVSPALVDTASYSTTRYA